MQIFILYFIAQESYFFHQFKLLQIISIEFTLDLQYIMLLIVNYKSKSDGIYFPRPHRLLFHRRCCLSSHLRQPQRSRHSRQNQQPPLQKASSPLQVPLK
jgi:hypothetical protein